MVKVELKKQAGGAAGEIELPEALFGAPIHEQCVRACYNQFMANQRAGTHSTLKRGEVRGGGKKPWRQKGTGRARAGSNRSPLWPGGGVTFGPKPRDYSYRVNKKIRRKAIASLLSSHASEGTLIVVESLDFDAPKTKEFAAALEAIGAGDARKALVVNEATNRNALLSARNLQNVKVINANNINVFDLLVADRLVLTRAAANAIAAAYGADIEDEGAADEGAADEGAADE